MQIDITPEYLASQGLSPTFQDRFWDKVFIMTEGHGCWIWTAAYHSKVFNYGKIGRWREGDGPILAHVASWVIHYGPIPKGICVCHKCDNPPCVRPDHLFLGTHRDNSNDKMSKGRYVLGKRHRGEANGRCTISDIQVSKIRQLRSSGMSQQSIADLVGTSQTNVSSILRGATRG